jgi:RsiW-degrading membrane proteinase PrsW (M82 family)
MTLKKYLFSYFIGGLSALFIGILVSMSGASTSIDAWILTLTIVGQDVGDRMALLARVFFWDNSPEALFGMSYLIGHSLLEEWIKFLAFMIAFYSTKPASIRQIVITGIVVGIGFATTESLGYYSLTGLQLMMGFILRAIGHGLFTGIIALLFGMWYFTQMRWIDSWARRGIASWLIRYEEKIIQTMWAVIGIFVAAVLHASVNIFASLGGQQVAVIILMIVWSFFVFFLMRPESGRPYGTIIREVDLLRQIVDAESDLKMLEKTGEAHTMAAAFSPRKARKYRKRFAKG